MKNSACFFLSFNLEQVDVKLFTLTLLECDDNFVISIWFSTWLSHYFFYSCLHSQRLKQLSQKFDDNVRDASNNFEKLMEDKKETKGLSSKILQRDAQIAR